MSIHFSTGVFSPPGHHCLSLQALARWPVSGDYAAGLSLHLELLEPEAMKG